MNYYLTPKGRDKIEKFIESLPLESDPYEIKKSKSPPLDIAILSEVYSLEAIDIETDREKIIDESTKGRGPMGGRDLRTATVKAFDRLESQGYIQRN